MNNILKSVVTVGLASFLPVNSEANDKPNIIYILTDDLGYGDLSCQGGKDIHTPNIDQLFNSGVRFTNFYTNCTVSSPTRAALITGCYPDMVGVPGVIRTMAEDNWGYMNPEVITLPEMLKKAGYQTTLIGKWHLGLESPNLPNDQGFDFFHGFLGDMMEDYWNHRRHGFNYMRLNKEEIDPQGHATEIFSNWAKSYIVENAGKKEPFFMYLAYNAPHFPIQPPEDWLSKVKKREPGINEIRAKTVALVEHLDFCIGQVIQSLKESGEYENTIIIFSSDNGGHLPSGATNGELRGGKQDMYEGGIKVPACMVWPKKIPAKSVFSNLMLTMDVFPTLCDIAGVDINHRIDGISMFPGLFQNSKMEDDRTVFFMRREGGLYGGLCYYAIRKGGFKLLHNSPYEELQLFNIDKDPLEKNPLDDKVMLQKLKQELSQHIRRSGAIPWQKQ